MGERKSYSVRLLPQIFKKLKLLAVKNDKTVSSLLEEAIIDIFKKYKEK